MIPRARSIEFVAALVVLLGTAAACSPPDDPADAGDDTGWTVDTADGGDESAEPDGDDSGELQMRMGRSSDDRESYDPYPDDNAEIELIHGFQGGYHIEPALFVTGVEEREFSTTIDYYVERIEDGEQLNRRETYEIDQYGWLEHDGGFLHHSNPVVFKTNDPSEVVGDAIRVEVTVDFDEGGQVNDTQTGELVDGGRP